MAGTPHELIPTQDTLLQKMQNLQDQSSWKRFFDTYRNLIYGVAVKGGLTPSEAEDVVQETMASVVKHIQGFKYDPAIGSFKAWLLNMTRWRITDQLRKRGPQVPYPEFSEETDLGHGKVNDAMDHAVPELEKLWDAEWEKNLLDAAMTRVKRDLNPKHFQIFDCYVNKGWTPERVAKAFDVPVGQVFLAKHRVTEQIKQEVARLSREMD
jgi:RNA polymerase sigma factor (sigma-70 family)